MTTPSVPPQATGPVTVSAEATDTGSGIQSVTFQAFYMGQWTTICVDTTAPYSCTTDSTTVADGAYQVRVITTDNAGVSTTGSTYQLIVDNQTPSGSDVTAAQRQRRPRAGSTAATGSGSPGPSRWRPPRS